jgi:hypothetical protein
MGDVKADIARSMEVLAAVSGVILTPLALIA